MNCSREEHRQPSISSRDIGRRTSATKLIIVREQADQNVGRVEDNTCIRGFLGVLQHFPQLLRWPKDVRNRRQRLHFYLQTPRKRMAVRYFHLSPITFYVRANGTEDTNACNSKNFKGLCPGVNIFLQRHQR